MMHAARAMIPAVMLFASLAAPAFSLEDQSGSFDLPVFLGQRPNIKRIDALHRRQDGSKPSEQCSYPYPSWYTPLYSKCVTSDDQSYAASNSCMGQGLYDFCSSECAKDDACNAACRRTELEAHLTAMITCRPGDDSDSDDESESDTDADEDGFEDGEEDDLPSTPTSSADAATSSLTASIPMPPHLRTPRSKRALPDSSIDACIEHCNKDDFGCQFACVEFGHTTPAAFRRIYDCALTCPPGNGTAETERECVEACAEHNIKFDAAITAKAPASTTYFTRPGDDHLYWIASGNQDVTPTVVAQAEGTPFVPTDDVIFATPISMTKDHSLLTPVLGSRLNVTEMSKTSKSEAGVERVLGHYASFAAAVGFGVAAFML